MIPKTPPLVSRTLGPVYFGHVDPLAGQTVVVDGCRFDALVPASHAAPVSDRYTWGGANRSSRTLAWALLFHATNRNAEVANDLFHRFTHQVVSQWPAEGFCITRAEILRWIGQQPLRSEGRKPDDPEGGVS